MIRIVLTLFPIICFASIFGTDDRQEFYQIKDPKIKELTKSSAALMYKDRLERLPNGDFKIVAKSLKDGYQFCADAAFSDQGQVANCSGALISKDQVLTAGHCIDLEKGPKKDITKLYVVFDYKRSEDALIKTVPKENVYEISKIEHFEFDQTLSRSTLDLAIIKLDRPADRPIAELDLNHKYNEGLPVFALGYPLGVALKLADNSSLAFSPKNNSFRHELDTFSVNSGSPIFDADTYKIIGVHVRGTGRNYFKEGRECNDWFRGETGRDFGEANTLNSLRGVLPFL